MEGLTALPPGFQFRPTEEELVCCYLRDKVVHLESPSASSLSEFIREVDVFEFDPVELPEKAGIASGDHQWFFFTERIGNDAHVCERRRDTRSGVWETVGEELPIFSREEGVVGIKKTMVFYRKDPPSYTETYWRMNEYVLSHRSGPSVANEEFAICRVFLNPRRRLNNAGHSCVDNRHVGTDGFHFEDILEQVDKTTDSYSGEIDFEKGLFSENDELQRVLMAMLDAEDDPSVLQSLDAALHQEMFGFDSRVPHASDVLSPALLEGDFIELNDLIPPILEATSAE